MPLGGWIDGVCRVIEVAGGNGRFCHDLPALLGIKGLSGTKTRDKTFAVLGGF